MGIIVLHKLEAKTRTILRDGRCTKEHCSAFIGATDDKLCQFGIGLLNENGQHNLFWSMLYPHLLITAWRGMHILDRATDILPDTICHAFYAGMDKDDDCDVKRAVIALSEQIFNFKTIRGAILRKEIADETLDMLLRICNNPNNYIDVDISELKRAVEAGIIRQTAEVSRTYKIAIDQELEYERIKKISQQPLPEAKSFRAFCKKCGITNLIDDPYSERPGYWVMDKIDQVLVFYGLRHEGIEKIWCAEEAGDTFITGRIGRPVLRLSDQREVVLSNVRFKDDDMWGKTYPVKSGETGEWTTLSELLTLNPRFVGLTFDQNSRPTTADIARGYIAIRAKNPVRRILNAVASASL